MSKKIMFVLLVGVMPIYAVPVTMLIEGVITEQTNNPSIGDDIPIGTSYSGHLTYDTDDIDWQLDNPHSTTYEFYGSADLSVSVGSYALSSENIRIIVRHKTDYYQDTVYVSALDYSEFDNLEWSFGLTFMNTHELVLASTELPTEPLNLQDWPYAIMDITDMTTPSGPGNPPPSCAGSISSITPEPASLALLAIGGLVVVRRR